MVGYNESERHKRYKQKVANVLRSFDYTVFGDNGDDEVSIRRDDLSPPYYIDVCGCNDKRILVIEIDGYRGHKTRYAICKDKARLEFIKEKLGKNCEVYRFAFWQLKNCPDSLIAEELRLIHTNSRAVVVPSNSISQKDTTDEKARCIQ